MAVEAAEYLVSDEAEQYTISAEKLAIIEGRLQSLRGDPEFPAALEDLGKLATCLRGAGSPTIARALVSLIAGHAAELRALRLRLCGATDAEQDSLLAFGRFSGERPQWPQQRHTDARSVRDFRIAFLLDRQSAESTQEGRSRRTRRRP